MFKFENVNNHRVRAASTSYGAPGHFDLKCLDCSATGTHTQLTLMEPCRERRTPFPRRIAGAEFIAARRVPSRPGELPELAVIIGQYRDRPEERAFAVWNASVRDGEWTAFEGDYDMAHGEAWQEFYRRIGTR